MTKEVLDSFTANFIILTGELAETLSFNRSIGQLYGFLYMTPSAASLEDIANACHMSKGNASIHLRTLENWGAVHRSWKPGTRKDYYKANLDLSGLALRRLREGIVKRLNMARQKLETLKTDPSLSKNTKHPENSHRGKRIEEIEDLLQHVESGLSLLPKLSQIKNLL